MRWLTSTLLILVLKQTNKQKQNEKGFRIPDPENEDVPVVKEMFFFEFSKRINILKHITSKFIHLLFVILILAFKLKGLRFSDFGLRFHCLCFPNTPDLYDA